MVILGNSKDNYNTATTNPNKSMGFDLSATQSCFSVFLHNIGQNINKNNAFYVNVLRLSL